MSIKKRCALAGGCVALLMAGLFGGCAGSDNGAVEIEVVSYKPEAVAAFETIEDLFNETHEDIKLKIESPNEAMTILKTRFVREDYPDIVAIGGDMNYSMFLDAGLFENIEGMEILNDIKESYLEIDKELELVPMEGVYAVPMAVNAAGILYNREMFEEHGWDIPATWSEFTALCDQIESEGILPLYSGYKDTWTILAPWNALAVTLADPDIAYKVNAGEATFAEAYEETAVKLKEMLKYAENNPYAYAYNDAATAFANGESAMWAIGSYAIPQVRSVNPDMEIGSFVFPASDVAEENVLNSGIDLQYSIMKESEHIEEAKEVIDFLMSDEVIDIYLADQGGLTAKKGDFAIPEELGDMKQWIDNAYVRDFQDHHYPSEMSVDAMLQTYLLDDSDSDVETFLTRFDNEWLRYNRDLIAKVKRYEEEQAGKEGE